MVYYKCNICGWEGNVHSQPRCLACARRRTTEWRKKNPDKVRAQKRRYDKRRRTERRDEYNAARRRSRSSESNAKARRCRIEWYMEGNVTRLQLIDVYEQAHGNCNYCGRHIDHPRFSPLDPRGFDHVIPRAKGGQHTAHNVVVCCRSCNELKGDQVE